MPQPYAISLTSVPPRFSKLGPVLQSLVAQRPAPLRVLLCLARSYERYPGAVQMPEIPAGVEVIRCEDFGSATKVLEPAQQLAGQDVRLIYCDDDWMAGPGWAEALLAAGDAQTATTGQGFGVERLGRVSRRTEGCVDIAQGFSGVSIDPAWLRDVKPPHDPAARLVDDIWLSAQLGQQGIAIRHTIAARAALHPAYDDPDGLQYVTHGGMKRAEANQHCARLMHQKYGIWPEKA